MIVVVDIVRDCSDNFMAPCLAGMPDKEGTALISIESLEKRTCHLEKRTCHLKLALRTN